MLAHPGFDDPNVFHADRGFADGDVLDADCIFTLQAAFNRCNDDVQAVIVQENGAIGISFCQDQRFDARFDDSIVCNSRNAGDSDFFRFQADAFIGSRRFQNANSFIPCLLARDAELCEIFADLSVNRFSTSCLRVIGYFAELPQQARFITDNFFRVGRYDLTVIQAALVTPVQIDSQTYEKCYDGGNGGSFLELYMIPSFFSFSIGSIELMSVHSKL